MNRLSLSALLLSALSVSGCKTVMISPDSMASVNFPYPSKGLTVEAVKTTRKATTIQFEMEHTPESQYRYASDGYLMDEMGRRYPLMKAEGIELDTPLTVPDSGKVHFSLSFAPLPKEVQVFDYIEGNDRRSFRALGIHDGAKPLDIPENLKLPSSHNKIFNNWFRDDSVVVRGRIVGYDAKQFHCKTMGCYWGTIFENVSSANTKMENLDIAPDGTFEKHLAASFPVRRTLSSHSSKAKVKSVPFYACPGDTIDITLRPNEAGVYECHYNSGSSKEVERWLKSSLYLHDIVQPLTNYRGKFSDIAPLSDQTWNNLMKRVQMEAQRENFTLLETQLALAEAQVVYAESFMNNVMYREIGFAIPGGRQDGKYYDGKVDSTIFDTKNYASLHRVDWNNPMLLTSPSFDMLVNRIRYSAPVLYHYNDSAATGISSTGKVFKRSPVGTEMQRFRNRYHLMRMIMGGELDNMMAQICVYDEMRSRLNYEWKTNEEYRNDLLADSTLTPEEREEKAFNIVCISTMKPHLMPTFAHSFVHDRAERYLNHELENPLLAVPLSKNGEAASFVEDFIATYPGKYLVFDFWDMSCVPCRGAIENGMGQRAQIAARDDVKVIFVAGEEEPGGSQAYRDYVEKWKLDGEDFICVSREKFARLQEFFRFSGIPHYETITPGICRVRDGLKINGFFNFEHQLDQLKAMLEKK